MNKQKKGSILIVGGGIGGIQASLDLANSGFFVYLLEKDPGIGGVMSTLDKTFPTNDCSMCILSPILVECGRHPNINIITKSRIKEISGSAGNFKVKIEKEPRYIDLNKCTSCGDCASICPVEIPDEFNTGLSNRKAVFKKYPQTVPNAFAIQKLEQKPPCRLTCPAGINVQGYVQMVKQGKYKEALEIIMEQLPLPGVLGRVCPAGCEKACRRQEIDAPVAIRALKRLAADMYDPRKVEIECAPEREERVAIIGSGPAGLSCAYHLARRGIKSTIFEALPKPGGMLRVGIPEHRLPRDVLDREIEVITNLGVEIKTNMRLGKDFHLKSAITVQS
ncbi:hypothetical protein JCM12298_22060 [Desulfothermus naphthae]